MGKEESSDDDVTWITCNGAHVPIREGETAGAAIQRHFNRIDNGKPPIKEFPKENELGKNVKWNQKEILTNRGKETIPDEIRKGVSKNDLYSDKTIQNIHDAYSEGKKLRELYPGYSLENAFNEEQYNPNSILDTEKIGNYGPAKNGFFEEGFRGRDEPEFTTGWRYGNSPEWETSRNFAEQKQEAGLSMMQIAGEEKTQTTYEMFNAGNKPVKWYGGFLLSTKGSDGEPLIVMPKEIKK
jgi:hypothetical protein